MKKKFAKTVNIQNNYNHKTNKTNNRALNNLILKLTR